MTLDPMNYASPGEPRTGETIFTVRVGGGDPSIHVQAGPDVDPRAALTAAIGALHAEWADVENCPVHAVPTSADAAEHDWDDRGWCNGCNSWRERHGLAPFCSREAIRDAEQIPVMISRGDLKQIDRITSFFDAIAGYDPCGLYDDAWNLRNGLVPFQPGDEHYDAEAAQVDGDGSAS
jgi:hypothetical protein